MSILHQFRSLAEIGVGTGGVHHRVGFAALDNRTRKDCLARFARRGQRFSGQRRLIDLHRVAGQQACVCGHDVPQSQPDNIARHQFRYLGSRPFSVSQGAGLGRQLRAQRGNFVARLMFLPKCNDSVGKEQKQNDEEIQPVSNHSRQNHCPFDHPWNRTPEIAQELQE